ncbi:hypothetical protein Ddc_11795 [Ditylenchus destructor]|nr:hypothetical protein Ddc_11795 [Ditylenchus destructor]
MATPSIIPDEDDNKNATVVLISRTNPYKVEAKEEQIGEGESTCQAAYKQCEQSETCRWHLSELQIKCPLDSRHCRREQCTKAIGRFTRYQWMYPQCIYSYPNQKPKWTCTQAMKLCQSDGMCLRNLPSFNSSCAIHTMSLEPPEEKSAENIACASATLPQCRMAIISVRGTFLETPCYCDANDAECMDKQNLMLPTNPCIELAMLDYHSNPGSSISALSTSSTYLKPKPPVVSTKSKIRTHHKPKSDTTDSENPTEVTLVPPGDESMDKSKKPVEKPSSTFSKYEEHIAKYKAPSDRLDRTTTTTVAPLKEEIEEEKSVQSAPVEPTSSAFQTSTDMAFEALNDTSIEELENTTRSTLATLDPEVQAAALKKLNARKQFRVKPGNFLPTGEYVTMRPPPKEGCSTRNIDGEWIVHYKDSIFRQYHDWSGTCSSWCECTSKEALECHDLGCLTDVQCEALHTTVRMGERLYLEGRGACLCLSGKFVCETSEEQINLSPGLYITLGYSKEELSLLREKVKKNQLEKSGLVSPTVSVANDIASRLQFALERILPENTMCRIALLDHFPMESVVLLQVQWYGVNVLTNDTQPKWHIGRLEKQCSPFVRELEHTFLLERADRYQLVLSTVKQIKVLDLLDGLPPALLHSSPSAAVSWRRPQNHVINLVSLYLSQLFGFCMFLFPMFRCF